MKRSIATISFDTKKNCLCWDIKYDNVRRTKTLLRLPSVFGMVLAQIFDHVKPPAEEDDK